MEVNFQTVTTGINYGAASGYIGVQAQNGSTIQVNSPLATFPPYNSGASVNLQSEGVYTMFVLGSEAAPIEVLNKDR